MIPHKRDQTTGQQDVARVESVAVTAIGDEGASALADALIATLVMRTARSCLQSHLCHPLLHPGFRCSEKHVTENVCC